MVAADEWARGVGLVLAYVFVEHTPHPDNELSLVSAIGEQQGISVGE